MILRASLVSFLAVIAAPASAHVVDGDACTHVVKPGDTLDRIATRNGVTVAQLVAGDSALKNNPNMIRVGQKIDVCAAKKAASRSRGGGGRSCGGGRRVAVHEVGKGDNLGKIASRYGVSEDQVLRRNPKLKADPNMLRLGQKLEICAGSGRAKNSKMCGYRTPLHHHEVVPGEHLAVIAGRYGVRQKDLQNWNPSLRNPNMLRVGQRVRLCPEIAPHERERISYTVQAGETFGSIAKKFDLSQNQLLRFQRGKLSDPNKLRSGRDLVVWVDGDIVPGFARISDDKGVLKAGVQLPPGKNYHIKWASGAWGTAASIRSIQEAASRYKRKSNGPDVNIGDISRKGGGPFPPHASHQHGRDVDVGYVLKGQVAGGTRFRRANKNSLDAARTWALLKAFIDTGNVTYIFVDRSIQKLLHEHLKKNGVSDDLLDELFQYPRRRRHGTVQHWKGHRNHFHVRFRR